MAPRTIYANLPDGLQPFTLWDASLADMGSLGVIPCTATGTTAFVLTPIANAFAPTPAYANNNQFSFAAASTSIGPVTANINGLGAKNVYKANGTTQATTGDITSGKFYGLIYNAALNAAAGGFYLQEAFSGAASDITGLAPSATIDTTNASNISSGTLALAQLPSKPAFFAHKDLTNQTALVNATYNNVTWPFESFDVGSFFDTTNNWWTPPAGYVALHTEVYQTVHAASVSPTFVAKIQREHVGITITNASPGVITWPLHGLFIGQPIQTTTSGALPSPFAAGTVYYVQSTPTVNTFTLSATHGGAVINTSTNGSGTHNGFADVAAGIGSGVVGFAGFAISQASAAAAYSNGTDHFIVIYFTTSDTAGNDGAIDGNPAHSHFSGHWIGP